MKALLNKSGFTVLITIFIGAPGAGKGTQANIVAQKLNLAHISSGDLFRKAAERDDKLGRQVKSCMEKGALVPDAITTQMVLAELGRIKQAGIILDGYPRNLSQARSLDGALVKQKQAVARVVYISVDEKELIRRLASRWLCRQCQTPYTRAPGTKADLSCERCGGVLYQRADDTAETVKARLAVYFQETTPLIEYYRRQGKLAEINGEGDVQGISQRIVEAIKS
jgi:adenylate kinase